MSMDIQSICVCGHQTGNFCARIPEEPPHSKVLPVLSVVQSLKGSYRVSLGEGDAVETGPMGVFIAPKGVRQTIHHCVDPVQGLMEAQWVFLDIEINRLYKIDDLFSFPLLLPPEYNEETAALIRHIREEKTLIRKLSSLDRMVEILFSCATPLAMIQEEKIRLQNYLDRHLAEPLSSEDLMAFLNCSHSRLYQIFRDCFGQSPCRYLNGLRIRHAEMLLSSSSLPVSRIAEKVGIPDAFYFSRLFRQLTGISPAAYRKRENGDSVPHENRSLFETDEPSGGHPVCP